MRIRLFTALYIVERSGHYIAVTEGYWGIGSEKRVPQCENIFLDRRLCADTPMEALKHNGRNEPQNKRCFAENQLY